MKQLKDQAAHFLAAILILTLPLIGIVGFVLAGFAIGFTREQGQRWVEDRATAWRFWEWGTNSWIDITFWTLGGLVAGLLI